MLMWVCKGLGIEGDNGSEKKTWLSTLFSQVIAGLEKKKTWIPACLWDSYLSKFACPGQVLVCSFNDIVGRQLAWTFARRASENEKLFAQLKDNLLVPDKQMALFFEPWIAPNAYLILAWWDQFWLLQLLEATSDHKVDGDILVALGYFSTADSFCRQHYLICII